MINLAPFGAGRIARIHAANVAAHPSLALHSVIDLDPEAARRLAEPFGARIDRDAEAALGDPAVQAVLIASSSHTHADLIIRPLKPGAADASRSSDAQRRRAAAPLSHQTALAGGNDARGPRPHRAFRA